VPRYPAALRAISEGFSPGYRRCRGVCPKLLPRAPHSLHRFDGPHYFDNRDGTDFMRDEVGMELDGIEAARDEATRGLADLAKDVLPGSVRREVAVECRHEADHNVLRAALWFESIPPNIHRPPARLLSREVCAAAHPDGEKRIDSHSTRYFRFSERGHEKSIHRALRHRVAFGNR
jgi:hypothetical protein